DLNDVLQRILEEVERVLPYDVASIRVKDENGTFRVVKSVRQRDPALSDTEDFLQLPYFLNNPIAISDVQTDPRAVALAKHAWIRSWLGAPIVVRNEVIGEFTLVHLQPGFYGEEHEPVIRVLATQVSIAVGNAQSFEAERRRLRELEAVQKSSLSLTASLQLPQVLDAIIESIANLMHPESVNIFLYEGNRVEFGAAMVGTTRLNSPLAAPRQDEVTHEVARTGKMLKVSKIQDFPPDIGLPDQGAEAFNAIISLPLKIGERVVGVMNMTYRQEHEFSDTELQTLQLLASHASIAIENARLYQTISDYAEQLADRVRERTYELERERAQLQAILDSMGEGLIYDEDLDIKYYNRALLDITGFNTPTWETQHDFWTELVVDEKKRIQLMHSLYTTINQHTPWRGEVTMRHQDGTPFEARITCHPVQDVRGNVTGAVMLIQDISADKELQAQKDRFISHASHELRTPLANLKTRLYLFKRNPDKRDYHMKIMENVADQMSELVEDLLDMSRFERGVIEMNQDWHVLQDLLNVVYEVQLPEAEKKQITFTKQLPDEPVRAWVDFKRLRQVITNLVVNAINYTPPDGTLSLRLLEAGDFVEIHVQDTGIGIPPELHEQVFQPFFRATQGAEGGTGLGLAISYQIVKQHQGDILLESASGQGSTFKVRLPVHPTA
ncbi:MAG: GAF domain-containing protein, partial [Anaerolineae bacterium]|nr:GAF domain-containing protein [Anaerolineae bacterium]